MILDISLFVFILLNYLFFIWIYSDLKKRYVELTIFMSGYYLVFPNNHSTGTRVERCIQPDNSSLWKVIKDNLFVLTKTGEFIFEPLPSNRTDEFFKETRFQTFDEAVDAYRKLKNGK